MRTLDHRRAPRRLEEAPPEGLKLLSAQRSLVAALREPPTYRYGLVVLWVHLHPHLDPEVLADLIIGDGDLIGENPPVLVREVRPHGIDDERLVGIPQVPRGQCLVQSSGA